MPNLKSMSNDVLDKLKQLPPDKQQEAEDFISFLLAKYSFTAADKETIMRKRKENAGRMKGKIWIADDFNNIPEGFEDYI